MRIGILAWDYPPARSGLAVAAREIAESLVEAGQEVRVLTLDRTGDEVVGGVRVCGCGLAPGSLLARMRRLGSLGHLAAPLAFARHVRRLHRESPFDLIEATNWYAPAAVVPFLTAIPCVTRHSTPARLTGALGDEENAAGTVSMRDRLDGRFAAMLERRSALASDGWISNTPSHARTIETLYGRADGRPHAVAGLSLPPARRERGRRAVYPEGASPLRLLFVGRNEKRKGFDLLLGAITILSGQILREEIPEFQFRLTGIAEADLEPLSKVERARVVLTGVLSDADLDAEYEAAHAVVAPSRYESFGLVYQEALAFGRPVIALGEDASARRFIGETEAGLLAGSSTAQDLAARIAALLGDETLRCRLAANARVAAGRFDRQSLARETLFLYHRVLDRNAHADSIGRHG